jgi:hypothetical protein
MPRLVDYRKRRRYAGARHRATIGRASAAIALQWPHGPARPPPELQQSGQ